MRKVWWMLLVACHSAGPRAGVEGTQSPFLSDVRQLTFAGKRTGEGYFSPDGQTMVFQSERHPKNPFYQIYTMDLESGRVNQVSTGVGKTTCGLV